MVCFVLFLARQLHAEGKLSMPWCLLSLGDCKLLPLLTLTINPRANITHFCIVICTFRNFLLENEHNDYLISTTRSCRVERIFQNKKKIKFLLTLCLLSENDDSKDTNPNKLNSNNSKPNISHLLSTPASLKSKDGFNWKCLRIPNECVCLKTFFNKTKHHLSWFPPLLWTICHLLICVMSSKH